MKYLRWLKAFNLVGAQYTMTKAEIVLIGYILALSDLHPERNGSHQIPIRVLASSVGLSESTVKRARDAAEASGWLKVKKGNNAFSSIYIAACPLSDIQVSQICGPGSGKKMNAQTIAQTIDKVLTEWVHKQSQEGGHLWALISTYTNTFTDTNFYRERLSVPFQEDDQPFHEASLVNPYCQWLKKSGCKPTEKTWPEWAGFRAEFGEHAVHRAVMATPYDSRWSTSTVREKIVASHPDDDGDQSETDIPY